MKRLNFIESLAFVVSLLLMPVVISAQSEPAKKETMPSVEQPLVREGTFADKLVKALKLGTPASEIEAENILGSVGIAPRNGWIADYPVTPDIVGEVRKSISDAADAKRIAIGKNQALKDFDNLNAELKMAIRPYSPGETYGGRPPDCENYANPTVVNNYYSSYGPPTFTYYPPPPDYYYLYTWVPYPFWWVDFFFPGFFILIDFHRTLIVNGSVFVVTNSFIDPVTSRVFRIDPVQRFSGRTFAGIGAANARGMLSTGIPRASERVFNRPRTQPSAGGRAIAPSTRRRTTTRAAHGGRFTSPSGGRGRAMAPSSRGAHGGRMVAPPSGGGRAIGPSSHGGRTVAPSGGGKTMTQPHGGGREVEHGPGR
jgi:hypothetical protein